MSDTICWLCGNKEFDTAIIPMSLECAHYESLLPDSLDGAVKKYLERNSVYDSFSQATFLDTESDSFKAKYCPFCGRKIEN